eukprot:g18934.t1
MNGLGGTGAQQSKDCSFAAGSVAGAPLRVSWFLVILFLSQLVDAINEHQLPLWVRITQVTVNELLLLFTVLCHEMGHGTMARRCGGTIAEVLLWPFGGICFTTRGPTQDPKQSLTNELYIVAAGPATHFPMSFAWVVLLGAYGAAVSHVVRPSSYLQAMSCQNQKKSSVEALIEPDGDPMVQALGKLTAIVENLAAEKTKRKNPALDALLDGAHGSGSDSAGSGAGKRSAIARRALVKALTSSPQEVYQLIEKRMMEDLSGRTRTPAQPEPTLSARAWVEHRSYIGQYKTLAHSAWGISGVIDCLVTGKVEEARARANLLLLQLDQVAADRGSWQLAASLSLEALPPFATLATHHPPDVTMGEQPFSKLLDPRWSKVALAYLKDTDDYIEKRKKLGQKGGKKEDGDLSKEQPSPKRKAKAKPRRRQSGCCPAIAEPRPVMPARWEDETAIHPELYSVLPTCGAQPTWAKEEEAGMSGLVLQPGCGSELHKRFSGDGVIFITCGQQGVQEAFAKGCGDGSLVRNLLAQGEICHFRAGRLASAFTRFVSSDLRQGGPGVAQDARLVMARNASVLALKRTGGASAGKFDFPQAALTPDFATEENSKRAEENGD